MSDAGWHVYVLSSERARCTYVGISPDPARRLEQHNGERPGGARFTRRGRPWAIAAVHGPYPDRGEAQRIEAELKRLRGAARLEWSAPRAGADDDGSLSDGTAGARIAGS